MVFLTLLTGCITTGESEQVFHATRLNNAQPVISSEHFEAVGASTQEGANINGPSVIRIPSWIPKEQRASPKAEYYMYFAHHKGRYIRLAWAENPEGPWQLYGTGATAREGERGVLDIGDDRQLPVGESLTLVNHIASPDVHVDNANQRIIMYFHGKVTSNGKKCPHQSTLVATSPWGLDFAPGIVPVILGGSYFRVIDIDTQLQSLAFRYHYAPTNAAAPWSAPDNRDACSYLWQRQAPPFLDFSATQLPANSMAASAKVRPRHLGLHRVNNTLYVFFSMTGEAPERILMTHIPVGPGCWACTHPATSPVEILRAEEVWEGSALAPAQSKKGAQMRLENSLRDPFVFEDQGQLYLFYSGGGERAIGVARLKLINE